MAIPKIIHQTYRSAEAVPPALRPGWDYRFYDDAAVETFIRSEFQPEFHQAYRRINPVYGPARAASIGAFLIRISLRIALRP